MEKLITGIHHVTAVSGGVQENIDFYTGVLGLRLVKKTVNFDDPNAYHFYFGDETGSAGTIMTTFPYGKDLQQGRDGVGKINTTAFSLPFQSLDFWEERLRNLNITFKNPQQRTAFEVFIFLEDFDGMGIELVFTAKEKKPGFSYHTEIPLEHSIRGIHHVEMWVESFEKTASLLTQVLNHKLISETSNRFRYAVEDEPGKFIDLLWTPDAIKGYPGRGMVHHVAFATPNQESQRTLLQQVRAFGLQPTEVKDRNYFTSIYFREPNGVLFEIATSGPGFGIDEDISELGMHLKLPSQYEEYRNKISENLPKFDYPSKKF